VILGPIEFTTGDLVSGPDIIFSIFGFPVSSTVVTTWFVLLFFYLFFKLGTKNLQLIPGKFQSVLEGIYEFLDGTIGQILGVWKKKYYTFFATLFLFISINIKNNGVFGYLKGFADPTPVMLPLNVVGEFAKPLNISMRLFGNMFAGMVIMGLIYMAVPYFVPAALHLYFDLFAGLVQSFVFVTLSMVYVQGSIGDTEYSD